MHPVTGIVYPTDDLYDDDDNDYQEVSIVATDRNGTGLISDPLKFTVSFEPNWRDKVGLHCSVSFPR